LRVRLLATIEANAAHEYRLDQSEIPTAEMSHALRERLRSLGYVN